MLVIMSCTGILGQVRGYELLDQEQDNLHFTSVSVSMLKWASHEHTRYLLINSLKVLLHIVTLVNFY